jgi:uncharacterized protein (TIGR03437 family)
MTPRRNLIFISCFSVLTTYLLSAQDRISGTVRPDETVSLTRHVHPSARPEYDLGSADPSMQISYATLHLTPAAGLEAFLAEQQSASSPNFHRWLTPEQFGDRFGLSRGDTEKVRVWLESQGLKVHDVARGRLWITFSGSAAQVGRAFQTQIHRYNVNGTSHFANVSAPRIPAAFQNAVSGVDGLHDFVPHPMHVAAQQQPGDNIGSGHYLAPDDMATIYNISPLYLAGTDGTGQKLAVIGRSGILLSDIQTFRKQFNLSAKDPQIILYGSNPGIVAADMVESDIDLEWSGAIAPNADILFVYATSVTTAAQYAVDQNLAPVMTYSYGSCEAENNTNQRGVAQQANAQGITWFASSGDAGATACDRNGPTPQATKGVSVGLPSSFPEITAVGGTEFNDGTGAGYFSSTNDPNGGSALSYIPERAWNDAALTNSIEGTGGGASIFFAKPVWQTGPGVPNDNARDTPDISLPASPNHYGYVVYSNGNRVIYGGTSVSSPEWAGLAALLNQTLTTDPSSPSRLGNINPQLYRLAQSSPNVFHDTTAGDNKMPCAQSSPNCVDGFAGFSAGPGYDQATGLGSVDATQFVHGWTTGTTSTTSLGAIPSTVNLGDTVQLTATVKGGSVTPSGTVTFISNDTAIGSSPLDANGVASLSVSAALTTAGDGTVKALYSGDGVYYPSYASATVTLNLPPSGALVVPFITPNPVYKDGTTNNWPFTVSLNEKAGVAATLSTFTIAGNNDLSLFSTTKIPAHGSISAAIVSNGLTVPVNRPFVFAGTDANGQSWTQQLTVSFLAAQGTYIIPGMSLTTPLATVQQNNPAPSGCEWSLPVILQETGGFEVTLTAFTATGSSLTSQLQSIFGTQRLAPFGMLAGTVCFPAGTATGTKVLTITGTSELGTTVTAPLSIPLAPPPASVVMFTASAASVTVAAAPGANANPATIDLTFAGGNSQWTASISPSNRASTWLTVSPTAGVGAAQLSIQASAQGLSVGVYNALLSIQAADTDQKLIQIPVTFAVGPAGNMTIVGLQNAFSYGSTFAPGMAMSVYGTSLANATSAAPARRFPLPLTLQGVSATVNGVSAPLYFVSPGQVNIQVPYETGAGPAVVAINNAGQIAYYPFTVVPIAPGLYSSAISNTTGQLVSSASGGDLLLLFTTGEGDVTPSLATGATPSSTITDPMQLPHARQPIQVTVGGVTAQVLFAGIPSGVAGLTQIDFYVPASAPLGSQQVVVTVGGVASQPITLNVTP